MWVDTDDEQRVIYLSSSYLTSLIPLQEKTNASSRYYNPFFTKKSVNSALLLKYCAMHGGKILQSPEDLPTFM
jgi:hypothetical protein